jgi:hypothetical protein
VMSMKVWNVSGGVRNEISYVITSHRPLLCSQDAGVVTFRSCV